MNAHLLQSEIRDERQHGFYVPSSRRVIFDMPFISGFRQGREWPTGVECASESTRRMLRDEFPSADVRIHLHTWREDFRALAAQMARVYRPYIEEGYTIRIRIVAYSWGMGRGAVQLCEALRLLGFEVEIVYSIDGVYYSRLMPWRAMRSPLLSPLIGVPTIVLPANVRQVKMWRQKLDYPRGHDVLIRDDSGVKSSVGVAGRERFLAMGHSAIDEDTDIVNEIKTDLRRVLMGGGESRVQSQESRAGGNCA